MDRHSFLGSSHSRIPANEVEVYNDFFGGVLAGQFPDGLGYPENLKTVPDHQELFRRFEAEVVKNLLPLCGSKAVVAITGSAASQNPRLDSDFDLLCLLKPSGDATAFLDTLLKIENVLNIFANDTSVVPIVFTKTDNESFISALGRAYNSGKEQILFHLALHPDEETFVQRRRLSGVKRIIEGARVLKGKFDSSFFEGKKDHCSDEWGLAKWNIERGLTEFVLNRQALPSEYRVKRFCDTIFETFRMTRDFLSKELDGSLSSISDVLNLFSEKCGKDFFHPFTTINAIRANNLDSSYAKELEPLIVDFAVNVLDALARDIQDFRSVQLNGFTSSPLMFPVEAKSAREKLTHFEQLVLKPVSDSLKSVPQSLACINGSYRNNPKNVRLSSDIDFIVFSAFNSGKEYVEFLGTVAAKLREYKATQGVHPVVFTRIINEHDSVELACSYAQTDIHNVVPLHFLYYRSEKNYFERERGLLGKRLLTKPHVLHGDVKLVSVSRAHQLSEFEQAQWNTERILAEFILNQDLLPEDLCIRCFCQGMHVTHCLLQEAIKSSTLHLPPLPPSLRDSLEDLQNFRAGNEQEKIGSRPDFVGISLELLEFLDRWIGDTK